MKVVIQRVAGASVDIAGERISEIGAGLLILLGVVPGDTEADVDWLIKKCSQMRIESLCASSLFLVFPRWR